METGEGPIINSEGLMKAEILQKEAGRLITFLLKQEDYMNPDFIKKLHEQLSIRERKMGTTGEHVAKNKIARLKRILEKQRKRFSLVATALDQNPGNYLVECIKDEIGAFHNQRYMQLEPNTLLTNEKIISQLASLENKVKKGEVKFPPCDNKEAQQTLAALAKRRIKTPKTDGRIIQ